MERKFNYENTFGPLVGRYVKKAGELQDLVRKNGIRFELMHFDEWGQKKNEKLFKINRLTPTEKGELLKNFGIDEGERQKKILKDWGMSEGEIFDADLNRHFNNFFRKVEFRKRLVGQVQGGRILGEMRELIFELNRHHKALMQLEGKLEQRMRKLSGRNRDEIGNVLKEHRLRDWQIIGGGLSRNFTDSLYNLLLEHHKNITMERGG